MKTLLSGWVFASLVLLAFTAHAAGEGGAGMPWPKGYVNLGAYFADMNSSFRLGSSNIGIGVSISAEEFLGLTTNGTAFRIAAGYRLGESRRHGFDLGWFSFDRSAEKTLT